MPIGPLLAPQQWVNSLDSKPHLGRAIPVKDAEVAVEADATKMDVATSLAAIAP